MNQMVIRALRAFVGFSLLSSVFGQLVVIPATVRDEAELYPETAPLVTAFIVLGIAGVACVQVVLVAVLMLLSMISADAIFTERAFLWVDTVIGATVAATLLTGGTTAYFWVFDTVTPIGTTMGVTGLMFGGVVVLLFLVVVRGLLRKATTLEHELAAVV
jgi:hypothetical protein